MMQAGLARVRRLTIAELAVLVAVVVAVAYIPHDARSVWRNWRNGSATPHAQRELAPAYDVGILAPTLITKAARFIPLDQTYYAIGGPNAPERSTDSISYVGLWATFSLLPRRETPRADQADWILSYGANLQSLGLTYRKIIRLGPGVQLAEVKKP
jgi:hypothetical protein